MTSLAADLLLIEGWTRKSYDFSLISNDSLVPVISRGFDAMSVVLKSSDDRHIERTLGSLDLERTHCLKYETNNETSVRSLMYGVFQCLHVTLLRSNETRNKTISSKEMSTQTDENPNSTPSYPIEPKEESIDIHQDIPPEYQISASEFIRDENMFKEEEMENENTGGIDQFSINNDSSAILPAPPNFTSSRAFNSSAQRTDMQMESLNVMGDETEFKEEVMPMHVVMQPADFMDDMMDFNDEMAEDREAIDTEKEDELMEREEGAEDTTGNLKESSAEAVEVKKGRRSSRVVSKPLQYETSDDSDDENENEPTRKKSRLGTEKKRKNKRISSDKKSSHSESVKKVHKVAKLNDTELECPECEYRSRSVRGWVFHLNSNHSTTPVLAGLVLRCDCGHESFSDRHSHACEVGNVTVIRKRDGTIRRSDDPKIYPKTISGYAQHLHKRHKSSLKSNGIFLKCSCGLQVRNYNLPPNHIKEKVSMPISVTDHLKERFNRCRLIVLSNTRLDENDCASTLLIYGSIAKIELTSDCRAAFIDFECEHAPLLVARCFVLHKRNPEVPMPKGVAALLPGCSINNYLYLQHIPRSLSTVEILRCLGLNSDNVVYRLGSVVDTLLSSRVVIKLKDRQAESFTKNHFRLFSVNSNGRMLQFMAVPHIPKLTKYSGIEDHEGCEECNVTSLRTLIKMEDDKWKKVLCSPPRPHSALNEERLANSTEPSRPSPMEMSDEKNTDYRTPTPPSSLPPSIPSLSPPSVDNSATDSQFVWMDKREEGDKKAYKFTPMTFRIPPDWRRAASTAPEFVLRENKSEEVLEENGETKKREESEQVGDVIVEESECVVEREKGQEDVVVEDSELGHSSSIISDEAEKADDRDSDDLLSGEEDELASVGQCFPRLPSLNGDLLKEAADKERKEYDVYSPAPIPRWNRTSVVDQEEEENYRTVESEYLNWLTREDGMDAVRRDSRNDEEDVVPLPSSLPSTTWGKGIVVELKSAIDTVLPEKDAIPVTTERVVEVRRNMFGRVLPTFGFN